MKAYRVGAPSRTTCHQCTLGNHDACGEIDGAVSYRCGCRCNIEPWPFPYAAEAEAVP